jgi:integrase/recombinase XerC
LANQYLAHLASRAFSPATVRAYAYDLLNFLRFLAERRARLGVVATDLFDYLDWAGRAAVAHEGLVPGRARRADAVPARWRVSSAPMVNGQTSVV